MKKSFTLKFIFCALYAYGALNLNAQIADLDVSKYYVIQTVIKDETGAHHAFGINSLDKSKDGALIEQQLATGTGAGQLWQIIAVTDSTYKFINKNSGMALSRTTWRGTNPDIAEPTDVWHFVWRGYWGGVCHRPQSQTDEWQVWQPWKLGESAAKDTIFYSIASAVNFKDSCLAWNLWRRSVVLQTDPTLIYQNKNVCLFSGLTQQAESYSLPDNNYSYFFTKTKINVPASAVYMNSIENITVFSNDGFLIIKGEVTGKTIDVYSILGTQVYSTMAKSSELKIALKKGLYLVKTGNMVTKLVVE